MSSAIRHRLSGRAFRPRWSDGATWSAPWPQGVRPDHPVRGSARGWRHWPSTVGSKVAHRESQTHCGTMWEEMADDGPGLAGEAAQVFERVYRADPSRTSTNRCAGSDSRSPDRSRLPMAERSPRLPCPGGGAVFRVDRPELADQSVAVEDP